MKVILDLDQLLKGGNITRAEYEKFSGIAAGSTGTLAFNLLIGFGITAVSGAAIALLPGATTAIVIGLCILVVWLVLLRGGLVQRKVLANICSLIGALMTGGRIVTEAGGSLVSILSVTMLFGVAGVFAGSTLLAVLATLTLSPSIGARTGYYHASYFLFIQEPVITIILFSVLADGLFRLSKKPDAEYARIQLPRQERGYFLSTPDSGWVPWGSIIPVQGKSS